MLRMATSSMYPQVCFESGEGSRVPVADRNRNDLSYGFDPPWCRLRDGVGVGVALVGLARVVNEMTLEFPLVPETLYARTR
jgi:hypothetical protein